MFRNFNLKRELTSFHLYTFVLIINCQIDLIRKENNLGLHIRTGVTGWMIELLRHLTDTYAQRKLENVAQVGYKRSNKITNVFRHREIYRGFIVP